MYDEINWKRDKATVTPEFHGACWKQDGRYFDQEGNRVRVPGEPEDPAPGKDVAKVEPAAEKPKTRSQRQREARGTPAIPEQQQGGPQAAVDLRIWAFGMDKPRYRFGLVSKAIREKYNTVPSGERGAIDALIANGVITLDEAHKARPGLGLKD